MQDYGIDLTLEFLETISIRKFLMYLKGFTKNTALGNYFLTKNFKETNQSKTQKMSFDTSNNNSMKMFMDFSKGISNG